MKIYLDFDNTIFDTNRFYKDLLSILYNNGIKEDDIKEYNLNNSSPLNFSNYFINKGFPEKIRKEIDNLYANSYKYIYPDTYDFIRQNKEYITIYTYGNIKYQEMKLFSSGIGSIVKDLIITDKPKYLYPLDYKNSIFIDDNPNVIKGILAMGSTRIYRIKRKNNDKYNKIDINSEYVTDILNLQELTDLNLKSKTF